MYIYIYHLQGLDGRCGYRKWLLFRCFLSLWWGKSTPFGDTAVLFPVQVPIVHWCIPFPSISSLPHGIRWILQATLWRRIAGRQCKGGRGVALGCQWIQVSTPNSPNMVTPMDCLNDNLVPVILVVVIGKTPPHLKLNDNLLRNGSQCQKCWGFSSFNAVG